MLQSVGGPSPRSLFQKSFCYLMAGRLQIACRRCRTKHRGLRVSDGTSRSIFHLPLTTCGVVFHVIPPNRTDSPISSIFRCISHWTQAANSSLQGRPTQRPRQWRLLYIQMLHWLCWRLLSTVQARSCADPLINCCSVFKPPFRLIPSRKKHPIWF
jgi:hypothetical protein